MASQAQKDVTVLWLEAMAAINDWPPVSREYVGIALDKIEDGEEECELLPTGLPDLKALYTVAVRLEANASMKN